MDDVKKVWEIYVPTVRKSGKPIRTRHHKVWDSRVMKITGGLSIHSPIFGRWVSPTGIVYFDRVIPVRIVATEDEMAQVARMTLNHYPDEEAVMYYLLSDKSFMVFRNCDGSNTVKEKEDAKTD